MIYALLAVMGYRLIPICAIHPHRNALSSKAKYRNACWFMSSCQACEITQKLQTYFNTNSPDPVPQPAAVSV